MICLGQEKAPVRSKYEEDIFPSNHTVIVQSMREEISYVALGLTYAFPLRRQLSLLPFFPRLQ